MTVAVVCATPRGGHIEHAADLAAAIAELGYATSLVTRSGAIRYLQGAAGGARLCEIFPAGPGTSLSRGSSARLLLWENLRLLIWLMRVRPATVIVEEPRFPVARAARLFGRVVFIVHNVQLHRSGGLWHRLQAALQDWMVRHSDLCVVHGSAQAAQLEQRTLTDVRVAPLPGERRTAPAVDSVPPPEVGGGANPFFLCLGELRSNKGFPLAVEAARRASVKIVVAGAAVEPDALAAIEAVAHPKSILIPRFLDPTEFGWLLRNCTALVLPYTEFHAQSGILARAMAMEKTVYVASLPSLVEQAHGYNRIRHFSPSDVQSLSSILRAHSEAEGPTVMADGDAVTRASEWLVFARICVGV